MSASRVASLPALRLRRRGSVTARLAPGERLLIGRAPSADLTLADPSVSRLHARITWPEGRPRPVVEDLHSANGVWLDDRRVAGKAELRDGVTLRLGTYALEVELGDDAPPALLDDGGTVRVRLFSEAGPELSGQLRDPQDLRDLLLDLEARRRTGTLALPGRGQVVFARGRVVHAETSRAKGVEALGELLTSAATGPFRFQLDVAPLESRLDVSIRAVLERAMTPTERLGRGDRSRAS
ncbi:MAG: FHA domain-containing protein [Planctomycetes bacterium]|nr:FHA domain-containing protein [Planctomycetota bacterium]